MARSIVDRAPLVASGMERQWVRCKTCGRIAYYDFVRCSLSSPIHSLPCGHGFTVRLDQAVDFIDAAEAKE